MKVLLAHNNFTVQGGAEVFYHEVGRVLEENGHEVAYFSLSEPDLDNKWSSFYPSATDYKNGKFVEKVIGFPKLIYNKEAKSAFADLIVEFKPDLIHVFAIYVGLTPAILDAAREHKVPVVMSCNDYKHICPNYKLFHSGKICEDCKGGKFYKALTNKCCHNSTAYSFASMVEAYTHNKLDIYKKNVSRFLFASEFMAEKTEEFWGSENFNWGILRNPFNIDEHVYTGRVGDYFLFFGRLVNEKGVDILLKAAAELPNLRIKVVGNGPEEDVLKGMAEDLQLTNIEFLGPKWGDELKVELENARCVVVPSIWHENYPYVILQSLAAGKSVIGSNRGGITEILESQEYGWIYNAENPEDLASVLREVNDIPIEKMEVAGRAAQQFMLQNFNDKTFYESLIGNYRMVV